MSKGRSLSRILLVVACVLLVVAPVAATVAPAVVGAASTGPPDPQLTAPSHEPEDDATGASASAGDPPAYVLPDDPRAGAPVTFATRISAFSSDYRWQFGDGTSARGRLVAHTYAAPGNYTATLRVGDEGRVTNRTVVVSPGADPNATYRASTTRVTGPVFHLDSVTTSPGTVDAGQTVNVTATVLNVGTQTGTKSVELEVDYREVTDRLVRVPPGQHRQVSFTPRLDEPGTTRLGVDHSVELNVTVRRVNFPDFAITAVEGPEEVVEGEPYVVEVTLANVGNATGSKTVEFEADYREVAARRVTVPAGEERTIRFTHTFTEPGTQPVEFDHAVHRNVTVLASEPNFTVTDVRLVNDTVQSSEEVVAIAVVSNTGHADGLLDLSLDLDGEPVDIQTVALPVGGTERVVLTGQVPGPGEYTAVVAGHELPLRVVGPQGESGSSDSRGEAPDGERSFDVFGLPPSVAIVLPVLAILGVFVLSFTGWRP